MGFLDFFFQTDINAGLAQYQADPKGVLLDVRTREEYTHGHIPGSQNLPLQEVTRIGTMVPDQSTPLYAAKPARSSARQSPSQNSGTLPE